MTSLARAKRNSKAPNRFSSDNAQIETSNSNGETIIDYNDNSTSTTHNLLPINRTIKLKPAIREPLKVKLPKLKRPNSTASPSQSSTKNTTTASAKTNKSANSKSDDLFSCNTSDIRIHKIKLPSLSASRKAKSDGRIKSDQPNLGSADNSFVAGSSLLGLSSPSPTGNTNNSPKAASKAIKKQQPAPKVPTTSLLSQNKATPSSATSLLVKIGLNQSSKHNISGKTSSANASTATTPTNNQSKYINGEAKNISSSSISTSDGDKSSSLANTSFSSDDADDSSRMEIVVSQPEATNSSGIKCPCGVDDDLGVMVECENCSTWQHGHCINVGTEEDAYEGYICGFCQLPQDKAHDSLTQLTVGDKFQSQFKNLESLRNEGDHQDDKIATENYAHLNIDELSQAIKDLSRVLNSLKVKWRILFSQAYEAELRIWQNPFWSDDKLANSEKDKNFYFIDRCKSNLKLNISNMIKKMDERCQLIEYALYLIEKSTKSSNGNLKQTSDTNSISDILHDSKFKQMRDSLDLISHHLIEFKSKLSTFTI